MNINELTIFEKIIARIIPSTIIYETENIIVIKDINPQAPIHFLIISKEKFENISSIPKSKMHIIQDIFNIIQHLASTIDNANQYKLIINNGEKAGQIIHHLHIHFLAGF